jgi:hypothetical protein
VCHLLRLARPLWSQVLAQVPETARRDRGVYLTRQATAAAREAARIAVDTGSVRMRRELRVLERAMRPWQDAAVGAVLTAVLAPVVERG